MYGTIDCKIVIIPTPYFRFINTCFKLIVFIYRHWSSRINDYVVRKIYSDNLEGAPVVEIIFSLNTDGSSVDLTSVANQALKLRKMGRIQSIVLKPQKQS